MATGLIALLDDIAAIAKVAAASLDDTAAAAGKASAKAAGVVIDDTAVTPRYVHGFAAARELPIVGKIALGSVKNKMLLLLPGAMALSYFAPWAITPLLMGGGAYLCYEGAEKIYEIFHPIVEVESDLDGADPREIENAMVGGAIRTDLILSGEIMAITLADVADRPIFTQAAVLAVVGLGITALVYGVVALIVKADDVGAALARRQGWAAAPGRAIGRALVKGMPPFLTLLANIGTAAMLWVGGGIIIHALDGYGVSEPGHTIHQAADVMGAAAGTLGPAAAWFSGALGSGLVGLAIGAAIIVALHLVPRRKAH